MDPSQLWATLASQPLAPSIGRALLILATGVIASQLISRLMGRVLQSSLPQERIVLAVRVGHYTIIGMAIASALRELGFDLSVLLGAAGVLTVALGFASQTSASNVISGVFLVAERPFSIGDTVRIGTTTGDVVSIELLSVCLRTPDNLYVRVPNEAVMKAEITNLTRFPIRRVDLPLSIAYHEDPDRVRALLIEAVDANPLVLDEPRPGVRLVAFGPSGIDLLLFAWTTRENFIEVKDAIASAAKVALDKHCVEIPFPHVSIYAGSQTEAVPIRLVSDPDGASS